MRHRGGVTDVDGLYFVGLPWQTCRGSALLGFVGADAEAIAGHIAGHIAARDALPDGVSPDRPAAGLAGARG